MTGCERRKGLIPFIGTMVFEKQLELLRAGGIRSSCLRRYKHGYAILRDPTQSGDGNVEIERSRNVDELFGSPDAQGEDSWLSFSRGSTYNGQNSGRWKRHRYQLQMKLKPQG